MLQQELRLQQEQSQDRRGCSECEQSRMSQDVRNVLRRRTARQACMESITPGTAIMQKNPTESVAVEDRDAAAKAGCTITTAGSSP
jgi:hypothetical protein